MDSAVKVSLTVSLCVSALSLLYAVNLGLALAHEKKKRSDDRRGRIKAEKKLAEQVNLSQPVNKDLASFRFSSIGDVTSVYMKRFGTPRQPGLVETATALIKLKPELINCLSDIEGFSHLWVSFVFHRNTNIAKLGANTRPFDGVKSLVTPPRVKNLRVGVFATRMPHRPNPIGLSLVRLISVDRVAGTLKVAGLDAVDGSPILDLKPYLPHVESVHNAKVPLWVTTSYEQKTLLVTWKCARALPSNVAPNWSWLSYEEVLRVIEETLSISDLRSNHQKDSASEKWVGELCVAGFAVKFRISAEYIEILEITPAKDEIDAISD